MCSSRGRHFRHGFGLHYYLARFVSDKLPPRTWRPAIQATRVPKDFVCSSCFFEAPFGSAMGGWTRKNKSNTTILAHTYNYRATAR